MEQQEQIHADWPCQWEGTCKEYLAISKDACRGCEDYKFADWADGPRDKVDEENAERGDVIDLEALASIPTHKTATRECPACGSTVELEYIPPRAAQRGYWTGRCVCGSRDVLQVIE